MPRARTKKAIALAIRSGCPGDLMAVVPEVVRDELQRDTTNIHFPRELVQEVTQAALTRPPEGSNDRLSYPPD